MEVTEAIREWDYGDYEGLTSKQIRERREEKGEGKWDIWRDGCPGGEYDIFSFLVFSGNTPMEDCQLAYVLIYTLSQILRGRHAPPRCSRDRNPREIPPSLF